MYASEKKCKGNGKSAMKCVGFVIEVSRSVETGVQVRYFAKRIDLSEKPILIEGRE
jgi:hypothetical protein